MKRKVVKTIFIFSFAALVLFMPVCGGKDAAPVSDEPTVTDSGISDGLPGKTVNGIITYSDTEIKEMFLALQDELLAKLGDDYEVVPSGSEGTYEGYYYKELGLTYIFNHKLLWIDCDDNIDIHGARPGYRYPWRPPRHDV